MTWYPKEFANVAMTDIQMRTDPSFGYPGRTYRFYTGKTVFDFGYGLSYSNYSYKFVSSPQNKIFIHSNQGLSASRQMLVSEVESNSCKKVNFKVVVGVENHGQASNQRASLGTCDQKVEW